MELESEQASFFSLPLRDVVFPHIFCHLNIAEIWRFRAVSRQCLFVTGEYFRTCPSLVIDLSRRQNVDGYFQTLNRILKECESLQKFHLKGVHSSYVIPATLATDQHALLLSTIVNNGLVLRGLYLENIELRETHDWMIKLSHSCFQLKELLLCSITPFDDEALDLLTLSCTSLVRLTLRNVPIKGHSLLRLVSQSSNLKHLCVSYILTVVV